MARAAHEDSRELLHRARGGDPRALADLVEHYRTRLIERIRMMMGTEARRRAESDDFLQGVLLETARQLPGLVLRDERALFRWMTGVARNQVRATVRTRRDRAFDTLSASWSGDAVADADQPSPSSQADRNESRLRLVEAIEALAEDHRRVVELRDLDGLSFREIGEHMGRGEDAARMLHARAMRELVRRLR